MTPRQAVVLLLMLICATLALLAFETAAAAPPALAPTEEPTKRPYVFPTPVFIPTYPTDVPIATTTPPRTTVATPEVASPKPAALESYTVQSGDNPWTIAQKVCGNGAKSSSIMQENNIADSTRLRVGTVLKIPADCFAGSAVLSAVATPTATLPDATPMLVSFSVPISTPVSSLHTPTPSTFGSEVNVMWQVGMMVVNIGSGLLMLGSILSGASSWIVYRRIQFISEMTHRVRRLRIRQKRSPFG
jgi:LysM repeat protein